MGRRGRPRIGPLAAVNAYLRFEELRDSGLGVTEAEQRMMEPGDICHYYRINTRQGVRKRRKRGKAVYDDPVFVLAGLFASILLADPTTPIPRRDLEILDGLIARLNENA